MPLDLAAAERVIDDLAERLGTGRIEAAEGILTIINNNMANAMRSRTVQKGIDPRGFALVAFGGAGPLHGAEVAAILGIPEVIVPPFPGITSAMGLLTTDLKYDAIRTQFQTSTAVDLARLNADLAAMEGQLAAALCRRPPGPGRGRLRAPWRSALCRPGLRAQGGDPAGAARRGGDRAGLAALSIEAHHREYGHAFAESPIEIVNLRVSGIGAMPKMEPLRPPAGGSLAAALTRVGQCVFRLAGGLGSCETGFYQRHKLPVGETPSRPGRGAAEGQHDGDPAGLERGDRRRRQSHPQDRRRRMSLANRPPHPHRSRHRRGDPRRAREHRDRDGPQAHAHELFQHHPRIRGFRRRAHRRRGPPALRMQDEHAAAIRADPGLYPRHAPAPCRARRRRPPRRRHHAQRPLWRRLARARRRLLRAGLP